MASIFISLLSSCTNDDNNDSALPVITSVSKAEEGDLTPTTLGQPNNMYIIQGTGLSSVTKIYFNNTDTYFNPTLVTDNAIFVTIDINTPYENVPSELKVVTKSGEAVFSFVIAPPAPQITKGFNPVNASAGDEITIYGNYFLDPTVKIGDVTADVISSTLTEIKVKVPAGVDKKFITVTTISGSVTTDDAIGSGIYDDKFYSLDNGATTGWGVSNVNLANTNSEEIAQGTKAIKFNINQWSGFQIDMWNNGGVTIPVGAKGIKFKIKSNNSGKIGTITNGDWGHIVYFDITTDYDTYVVKWSDLGLNSAPTSLGQFTIFNTTIDGAIFYVDDIAFDF